MAGSCPAEGASAPRSVPLHLYTIPADQPFLATLAEGLVALAGGDPLRLPRMTVLLPTRRAVRSLREAFLRLTGEGSDPGAPLLLPCLRPMGDLDADEPSDDETLAVPPAIPPLRRHLLLTRLVLEWSAGDAAQTLLPGQAAALAAALARLIDTAATEAASFADLAKLAPLDLAEHWQVVLRFLDILPRHWPAILAAEGALDPAERRNRLLARQAALWRRTPPRDPVIAAGLTGGIPALEELVEVVAGLDNGMVILPGLDRDAAPGVWTVIADDPAHPQYLSARLLDRLALTAADVRLWRPAATRPRASRLRLVSEALRPANLTDAWRDLKPEPAAAIGDLHRYDCASPQQEATTIALLLRRKLETPGATAALVTPDRALARRVTAELRRWHIDIDDSAGVPLARTPPGAFLRLVLDMAASELAPVPLLAALKHPLAAGGLAPEEFRELARRLEGKIRGPRPAPGIAGLRAALGDGSAALRRFIDRIESCLGELPALLAAKTTGVAELATAHIAAAERLAASRDQSGVARLWREAAGEAAAGFCHDLLDAARDFPPLPGRHYPALFETLSASMVVRPAYGRHPRLAIWGLVEARLQQADLIVLGGLNEGIWPGAVPADPWMSRQMRAEFGIPLPERAVGIAAHDFAQALGAPEVALTRAARSEGVPTVPSRWLLRLDAVLRAVGLEGRLGPDPEIAAAAAASDGPAAHRPLPAPAPRPPLAARPRKLAVTDIETWRRDPYAIYAKHVLRLKALNPLDADPDRADLGIAIHQTLAEFVRRHPRDLPPHAELELLDIGRWKFGALLSRPGAWAFWWPRFQRIAAWFIAEERLRRGEIAESVSEVKGELVIAAPGGAFTITAIADRIDRLAAGELAVIDYKTGSVPRRAEIEAAIAVQLPLEGAIAEAGGFAGIPAAPVAALDHWRLGGGNPAGSREPAGDEPGALIAQVLAAIGTHVALYDDPATAYRAVPIEKWRPRYSDYAHLERLIESETEW
ncbi:MAG TPA: double-strand break repair protein AddB [Stellaceae bacterium]|nr:double-strand break repair protein AddB [Stellaceae bacterium]